MAFGHSQQRGRKMVGSDGIVIGFHRESTPLVANVSNAFLSISVEFDGSFVESADTGWRKDKGMNTQGEQREYREGALHNDRGIAKELRVDNFLLFGKDSSCYDCQGVFGCNLNNLTLTSALQ